MAVSDELLDTISQAQLPGTAQVSVLVSGDDTELAQSLPATYDQYRQIRAHPTVALARRLSTASLIKNTWSVEKTVEGAPDEWVDFIADQLVPMRPFIYEAAVLGMLDWGWQPFEKVFEVRAGRVTLRKLKPLLQELTIILVDNAGNFAGFKNNDVRIPLAKALNIAFQVEGTYWYGTSLLEQIRPIYERWVETDAGARRYDRKVAGSHFVVHYPVGTTLFNGTETDNAEIARQLLNSLESSGSIMLPREVLSTVDELNQISKGWDIAILEDKSQRQPGFIDRLRYLDTLIVRAFMLPERTVLEGEFGTKAEAATHMDLAVQAMEVLDQYVSTMINWHVVDQLLAINWGDDARGAVRLVPAPLVDEAITFLRDAYLAILKQQAGFLQEMQAVDVDAMRDRLGVPTLADADRRPHRVEPLPAGMEPADLATLIQED